MLFIGLIILGAFITLFVIEQLINISEYYSDIKEIKNYRKYVKLSCTDAINLYKCGVKFTYYGHLCYFVAEPYFGDIYVIFSYLDNLKFSKFLDKKRVNKNESQSGYEYLISKIESYSKENLEKSNDCFDKAIEEMKKCYNSDVDIKEFIKKLESIKF